MIAEADTTFVRVLDRRPYWKAGIIQSGDKFRLVPEHFVQELHRILEVRTAICPHGATHTELLSLTGKYPLLQATSKNDPPA